MDRFDIATSAALFVGLCVSAFVLGLWGVGGTWWGMLLQVAFGGLLAGVIGRALIRRHFDRQEREADTGR